MYSYLSVVNIAMTSNRLSFASVMQYYSLTLSPVDRWSRDQPQPWSFSQGGRGEKAWERGGARILRGKNNIIFFTFFFLFTDIKKFTAIQRLPFRC